MKKISEGYEVYRRKLYESLNRNPSMPFIMCMMNNRRISRMRFSKLSLLIEEFAREKERYGFRDGDRIFLLTSSIADAHITFEILSANHITVVSADPGIPAPELLRMLEDTKVAAIFTDRKCLRLIDSYKKVPIFQLYGLKSNFALLREASEASESHEPTPESIAIIFSSGTTARMKPVEISYEALCLSWQRHNEVMELNSRRAGLPFLMVFPMSHISGFSCAVGMTLYGLTVATVEKVDSAALVGAIKSMQPVEFAMVPKVLAMFLDKMEQELKAKKIYGLYRFLRRVSAFSRTKLGIRGIGRFLMTPFRRALFGKNMYVVSSGGAPCPSAVTSEMLDLGLKFVVNYSSTECGVPILETDKRVKKCLDGVGRIDSDPSVEIRINDEDETGTGEIYVKSRYGMIGYYNEPGMTANAYDGGWFKTGDNGFIDNDGNLHIVGRSKDSIMLSSGKKVAPDDIETMLIPVLGLEISYSVVGVSDSAAGCDDIHMFFAGDFSDVQREEISEKVLAWQKSEAKLYPIKEIHFIKELPKTSIGKVRRVDLRELVKERQSIPEKDVELRDITEEESPMDRDEDVLARINGIVMRKMGLSGPLTGYEDLISELGIDSLTMMEICNEIESIYGVFIGSYIHIMPNTKEISEYIKDPFFIDNTKKKKAEEKSFNAFDFPMQKKAIHRLLFRLTGRWFFSHLDFEIVGLENIKKGENYIFCPNHQTHVDGLWVWHALGEKCPPPEYIGCMAKMEHLETLRTRLMLKVLGGIPVDRSGNTMDSFKRSIEFIREGNSFLIHPEGTRTRNGKLGPFKSGAAAMAIESGTKLVPVTIEGGLSVWSFDMPKPKTRDSKTGQKKRVRIVFGRPISPEGGDAKQLTEELRKTIAGELENGI